MAGRAEDEEELRPRRMTRRLTEAIQDVMAQKGQPRVSMTLDHRARSVSHLGVKIANIGKDNLIWNSPATTLFNDNERELLEQLTGSV